MSPVATVVSSTSAADYLCMLPDDYLDRRQVDWADFEKKGLVAYYSGLLYIHRGVFRSLPDLQDVGVWANR